MNDVLASLSYCGPPPLPANIWLRWNLDGALVAGLVAVMIAHGARIGVLSLAKRRDQQPRRVYFYAGWITLAIGLLSPLCALGVALFAGRVGQHAWLTMVAAPLLVLAAGRRTALHLFAQPMTAMGVFAMLLWMWHWPPLYELTFRSDVAYWLMHITLTGAAVLLWRGLLHGHADAWLARIGAGFLTTAQMGLLGALLTLAPRALYDVHALSAEPWGLTPLEDQQLGGLIMWIPTGLVLLAAALGILRGALAADAREAGLG